MGPEMVCCKTGDKIWGLELEGRKESEDCLPHFLAGMGSRFPGNAIDLILLYSMIHFVIEDFQSISK